MRRSHLVAAALAAAAFVPLSATTTAATPPETGCPSSSLVLSVASLTALGYRVPAQADDPTNGGNGNGLVCADPWNSHKQENLCPAATCPVPVVYFFRDDTTSSK